MEQNAHSKKKRHTRRKGVSLIELVIFMLVAGILLGGAYSGGTALMNKAKISRTSSDMHTFSLSIEAALNSVSGVGNATNNGLSATDPVSTDVMADIISAVDAELPTTFNLSAEPLAAVDDSKAKIHIPASAAGGTFLIYATQKTDPWNNPYYLIFDVGERHTAEQSDFYITVVSAGPNGHLALGGNMEKDDIFLLCQYMDGEVSSKEYRCASDKIYNHSTGDAIRLTPATAFYIGGVDGEAATEANRGVFAPTNY